MMNSEVALQFLNFVSGKSEPFQEMNEDFAFHQQQAVLVKKPSRFALWRQARKTRKAHVISMAQMYAMTPHMLNDIGLMHVVEEAVEYDAPAEDTYAAEQPAKINWFERFHAEFTPAHGA